MKKEISIIVSECSVSHIIRSSNRNIEMYRSYLKDNNLKCSRSHQREFVLMYSHELDVSPPKRRTRRNLSKYATRSQKKTEGYIVKITPAKRKRRNDSNKMKRRKKEEVTEIPSEKVSDEIESSEIINKSNAFDNPSKTPVTRLDIEIDKKPTKIKIRRKRIEKKPPPTDHPQETYDFFFQKHREYLLKRNRVTHEFNKTGNIAVDYSKITHEINSMWNILDSKDRTSFYKRYKEYRRLKKNKVVGYGAEDTTSSSSSEYDSTRDYSKKI